MSKNRSFVKKKEGDEPSQPKFLIRNDSDEKSENQPNNYGTMKPSEN
jgi:hypothetical protein